MKRNIWQVAAIAFGAFLLSSCSNGGKFGVNDKASDESKVFDLKVEGEASIIDNAEQIQRKVDDIFMKNNAYVELYVLLDGSDELKQVDNFDDIKDKGKIVSTYNIVRYEDGSLMNVTEMPNRTDFENIYNTLYDKNGKIVKFQRVSRFMVKEVSQFIETSVYYFDSSAKVIRKDYNVVDLFNLNREVTAAEVSDSPGRITYDVFLTTKDFNDAHPLKID